MSKHGNEVEKVLNKMWDSASVSEQRFYQEKAAEFMKAKSNEKINNEAKSDDTEDTSSEDSVEIKPPPAKTPKTSRRSSNGNCVPKRESSMIGLFKREACCMICEEVATEQNPDLIKCKGQCHAHYHVSCVGEPNMDPATWKCSQCSTGKFKCLLCNTSEGIVLKCNTLQCGRFFHESCLFKHGIWPQTRIAGDKLLSCPAHICHTCASDNPKDPYMKYNSKLVKCIRCPTAYHSGDYCVAAGELKKKNCIEVFMHFW